MRGLAPTPYVWELWGAAHVIDGGCGGDVFDCFRSYSISRGREVSEAALSDPDSRADIELEGGEIWENWLTPTASVVHARSGEYDFVAEERHPAMPEAPGGEAWREDELGEPFPRLAAKYDG